MHSTSHPPVTPETIASDLSNALSQSTPCNRHDEHNLYAAVYIRNAHIRNVYPLAVTTLTIRLLSLTPPLQHLLPTVLQMTLLWSQAKHQKMYDYLDIFYASRPDYICKTLWNKPSRTVLLPVLYSRLTKTISLLRTLTSSRTSLQRRLERSRKIWHAKYISIFGSAPRARRKCTKNPDMPETSLVCAAKLRAFARVYQRCRETCYGNEETTHFYHAVQVVNTLHELVARNNPTARDAGGPVWCRIQVTQLSEMVDHFVAAIEDVLMKRPTHEFVFGLTGGGTGGRDGGIKTVRNKTGAVFNKLKDLDMLPKDDGLLPVSVGDSCLASRTYEMRLVRSLLMHQVFAKTQACRRIVSEIRSWKQAMDQRTAERT